VVSLEDTSRDVQYQHGCFIADTWDIDTGRRVEEYRVAAARSNNDDGSRTNVEPSVTMNEASLNPAAAIEALLASNSQHMGEPEQRQRLALPGMDTVLQNPTPGQLNKRPGVRAFLIGSDYAMQTDARPTTSNAALGTLTGSADGRDGTKDAGYLITAGEDRQLRFWDLGKISKSVIFSGRDLEDEPPTYR
jgi:phosphoinositide-3-kinase regulatory subunit 4